MSNEYLRAFVIGSSAFMILPFFYAVSKFKKQIFNFNYVDYTLIAPIGLGLMNVGSLILAQIFLLTSFYRFLLTSIIAPIILLTTVHVLKIYNYTRAQWNNHIIKTFVVYFFMVNIVLRTLDMFV